MNQPKPKSEQLIPASVFIICKNEEKHIARVLENTKDFAEVILVDSGSTDKTLEIASRYEVKIYHQDWLGFSKQKEFARNLCTSQWALNLDADEVIDEELRQEIIDTIAKDDCDGLYVRISGKFLYGFSHPWSKLNDRIKFFKKAKGHFPETLVHETITLNGKAKKAKGLIFDYGNNDLTTGVNKINAYSSLRAEEKMQKGKKYSILRLWLVFPIAWLKSYIIKRGFLNGSRGFIAAMNAGYYGYLKEAKLFEKNMEESLKDEN
jgi:glycosyltransferase involved in cell wall biosynthesis